MNIRQLYQKFPELEEIANRLHESEQKADATNKERKAQWEKTAPELRKPTWGRVYPEHAKITGFLKDGRWEQLPFAAKAGKADFEKALIKTYETRNPDAVNIHIYRGAGRTEPIYNQDIYFAEEAVEVPSNKLSSPGVDPADIKKVIIETLNGLDLKPVDNQGVAIQLIEKEYKHKFEVFKLEQTIAEKDREIKELHQDVADLEDELDELEEQLQDRSAELSGLQNKPKEKDSVTVVLGNVLAEAGKEMLRNADPKALKSFGLPAEKLKALFPAEEKKEESSEVKQGEQTSFSEAVSSDPLEGFAESRKKQMSLLLQFLKEIPEDQFKAVFQLFVDTQAEDGQVNMELLKSIFNFLNTQQS